MKGYSHLTRDQRYKMQELIENGFSSRAIAKAIGVSSSTVCRELKRNSQHGRYDYKLAQIVSEMRRSNGMKQI